MPPSADAPDLAVRTKGLSKAFGGRAVVRDLDLAVPRGAVYGFLGPNGSGKTTTIRMLLGLVGADAGSIEVLGAPIPEGARTVLPRVGALVEGPGFHPYLTGRANLERLDRLDASAGPAGSAARIGAALDRVGLASAAGKKFRQYSLGMKQRLAIAAALLVPRDLLVLDEPTNGLDPQGTREIRALVASLGAEGVTVLISSHLLSEIEQVCSHLGIMNTGRLVAQGRVEELRAAQTTTTIVTTARPDAAGAVLRRLGLSEVTVTGEGASGIPTGQRPADIVAALVADGVPVDGFGTRRPSLEDLFVELTGEGFDVDV